MNKRMNKEDEQTSRYAEHNKKERETHWRCWLMWKQTNEENTKLKKVQKKDRHILQKNKYTQIKMKLNKNKENHILWERQKKL